MRSLHTALALLALLTACLAFDDTVPFLFWSPKRIYDAPETPSTQVILSARNVFEGILKPLSARLCGVQIVLVVDQPGIHSSDLSRTSFSESIAVLKDHSENTEFSFQIPYISGALDVEQLARSVVAQCHGELVQVNAAEIVLNIATPHPNPYIVLVTLPQSHKESLLQSDLALNTLISAVKEAVGDNYVVVYTSGTVKTPSLNKRSTAIAAKVRRLLLTRRGPNDAALLSLFQKYQFFTAGINMAIGASLLFVAILVFGVTWVASIQAPVRFEGKPKRG